MCNPAHNQAHAHAKGHRVEGICLQEDNVHHNSEQLRVLHKCDSGINQCIWILINLPGLEFKQNWLDYTSVPWDVLPEQRESLDSAFEQFCPSLNYLEVCKWSLFDSCLPFLVGLNSSEESYGVLIVFAVDSIFRDVPKKLKLPVKQLEEASYIAFCFFFFSWLFNVPI